VVRSAAAAALAQIGPHNNEAAVPALAKALSDPAPEVRDLAAIALGSIGSRASPAVPELARALNDPVDYVRAPAADALGSIGPKASAAVQPLTAKLMTTDQGFVLASVAYALGDIGPAARDALPVLQQVLQQRRVGSAAQEAILKIQGKPVPIYHH
jgi:HEAT repeat protein